MIQCWQENPDDRPTFEILRDELKDMENQHKVKTNETVDRKSLNPMLVLVAMFLSRDKALKSAVSSILCFMYTSIKFDLIGSQRCLKELYDFTKRL